MPNRVFSRGYNLTLLSFFVRNLYTIKNAPKSIEIWFSKLIDDNGVLGKFGGMRDPLAYK